MNISISIIETALQKTKKYDDVCGDIMYKKCHKYLFFSSQWQWTIRLEAEIVVCLVTTTVLCLRRHKTTWKIACTQISQPLIMYPTDKTPSSFLHSFQATRLIPLATFFRQADVPSTCITVWYLVFYIFFWRLYKEYCTPFGSGGANIILIYTDIHYLR